MATKKLYTKTHEWIQWNDDDTVSVGISNFAQESLGDLVFVSLPEAGETFGINAAFAEVESVKSTSDINAPLSLKVSEINDALVDSPELINEDAENTWFIKATDVLGDETALLSEAAYLAFIAEEF